MLSSAYRKAPKTVNNYLYLGPFFSVKAIIKESTNEVKLCENENCEKLNEEALGNFCSGCGSKLEYHNIITPYSEVNRFNI